MVLMIAVYRRRYGATTDYEIAWVTGALPDLRARDDAWARMDPAHRRLCTDVARRTQPGHVPAPASLLALTNSRQPQVVARRHLGAARAPTL